MASAANSKVMKARVFELLFACLIMTLVLTVWAFPWFPTQDGGSHAYNAKALGDLLLDSRSPAHSIYEINRGLTTNWSAHLVLMPLVRWIPPRLADKTVITLILLLTAFGFWLCTPRESAFLLPYTLPLLASGILFQGFYSFLLGAALMLCTMALWLRRSGEKPFVLALLLLACWISHPLCWGAAVLALALMAWTNLRALAVLTVASAPGLVLAILFVLRFQGPSGPLGSDFETPFLTLHVAYFLVVLVQMLVLVLHGALVFSQKVHWTSVSRGLLITAGLFLAAWPLAPKQSMTGGFLPRRLLLFGLIFLMLWLAQQKWNASQRIGAGALGVLLGVLFCTVIVWRVAILQPYYAEFMSMHVRGSTAGVRYSLGMIQPDGSVVYGGVDLFIHAADWLAIRDGAQLADNYEAMTPHFPLRYKPGVNYGVQIDADRPPPCVQFDGDRGPDTFIVWDYPAKPEDPCARALLETLQANYVLAGRSAPLGIGSVWHKR